MADYQKMLNAGKMDPYHARKWLQTDPKAKDLLAAYAKKQGKSSIYELFPGKRGEDVFNAPHGDGLNWLQNIGNTTRQYIFDDAIDHATPIGPVSPGSQPSLEDLMRNSDIDLGPTPSEPIPKEEVTAQEIAEKDQIAKPDYRDPAKVEAEAEAAAAPKTLDQPEGGAAPATTQPAGPTGIGQRIKSLNDAAQSLPADVPLGTGGATTGNRARMNMQAEANRQIGDLIKQQKKQSDQNNFLRDRYDATNGRRAGAWDRLSDQQKDEAVKNYSGRSRFDDSNVFAQAQYQQLKDSGYTPPMADAQSQYEAASMNPPSVARADGTATTDEFGNMSAAQQNAFIQNYRYNPQGQAPETVQEQAVSPLDDPSIPDYSDKIVDAKQPISPLDDPSIPDYSDKIVDAKQPISPLDDPSIPDYSDKIVDAKQPISPLDDPSIPDYSDKIVDAKQPISPLDDPSIPDYSDKIVDAKQPISPLDDPSIPDYSDKIVDAKSPLDDPSIPDYSDKIVDAAPTPIAQNTPAPAPAPAPQKPKGQSPVYGKKPDGTYGVTGYRNLSDMKTGAYTPTMRNNERLADQNRRARSGEMENPFASAGGTYNRALGQQNEDAFAKRRAQQAELAKKAARQRELAAMPTPRANAAMDVMNGLPQADQVGIVNQYRKRRGEKPIFNPYSA